MKVMIVDDEPDLRALAALALTRLGKMDVITLSSGAEAVATATAESPDCILLDVMMPEISGRETFARLRADNSTSGIPVIFLTGTTAVAEVESLKLLGARAVLAKPFRPAALVETVRAATGVSPDGRWGREVERLKRDYIVNSGEKLEILQRHLRPLESGLGGRGALAELLHRFHQLAGSGASYDLPAVSDLAEEGERLCQGLLEAGKTAGPAEFARIGELIGSISVEFSRAQSAEVTGDPGPIPLGKSPSASVLIVDDDRDLATLITRTLEANGMRVRVAGSAKDARRALGEEMPDAALVDIVLPDGMGYDLVEHLRGLPGGRAPAVLVISKRSGFLDKVEAVRCGADGHFEKPLNLEFLVHRLHSLLKRATDEPMRVLIVEDDKDQAAVVEVVLSRSGFAVRTCANPEQFEADLVSFKPELVLLDVGLPGVSGFELARYLRQRELYATLPVLFLTTQDGPQARIQGVQSGGDELLTKPVVPEVLVATAAARIKRARELATLISRDGLTGLLTRSAFLERAEAVCAEARRRPERAHALVMIDLDHFKSVNDRFGHGTGDHALASFAVLLRRRLRQSDIVGRLGGEEFSVIVEDLTGPETVRLVSRLLDEFRAVAHYAQDGREFRVSFSAGVAMLDPSDPELNAWTRAADGALYAAKRLGRNRVEAAPTPFVGESAADCGIAGHVRKP